MPLRSIRASELSTYVFCHRAWWYRLQGIEPENVRAMQAGQDFHNAHGQQVGLARLLQALGWGLLLLALVILVVALTLQWLG